MRLKPRKIRIGAAPVVIGGDGSTDISLRLARRLHAPHISCKVRTFSDGESKITLSRTIPKCSAIIIVQSTHMPVDSNFIRALTLVSSCAATRRVIAVIPYMGYARQDRTFLAREIVTIKEIARLFAAAGTHAIVIVDMHSAQGLQYFGIPAINISAAPALAAYFAKMRMNNRLVVSPDAGAKSRAIMFAREIGCDTLILSKKRDRKTGSVRITTRKATLVRERDVILIDDIISTGSSIAKATAFLKSHGCRRVYVACTHALLTGDAHSKLKRAGVTSIVSTNTIPGSTSIVDVSGLVAQTLVR